MTQEKGSSLDQLKRALKEGLIDQATFDKAAAAISAQLADTGAIAQRQGPLAVGTAGVGITRDNYGDINTGLIIQTGTRPSVPMMMRHRSPESLASRA
jgi:hypothetical protein